MWRAIWVHFDTALEPVRMVSQRAWRRLLCASDEQPTFRYQRYHKVRWAEHPEQPWWIAVSRFETQTFCGAVVEYRLRASETDLWAPLTAWISEADLQEWEQ